MFSKVQTLLGRLLTIFGGAGSIFSGFLLMEGGLLMPIYWGMFVASLTALFVGWSLNSAGTKQVKLKTEAVRQQTVLAAVKKMGGQLTELQLAAESGWTLEESKVALKKFVEAGVADTDFTNQGDIVYVFRSMVEEKVVEAPVPAPVIASPAESMSNASAQTQHVIVENDDVIET